jgi:hypothetical protein
MPFPVMLALAVGGLSVAALSERKHATPSQGATDNAASTGKPVDVTSTEGGDLVNVAADSGHAGGNEAPPMPHSAEPVSTGKAPVATTPVQTAIKLAVFQSTLTDTELSERLKTTNTGIGGGMIY